MPARAIEYLTNEAREYKANVAAMYGGQRPIDGPVSVTIRWYRAMKSGDLDKRIGVLFDALQGVCYHNDKQVTELHASRHEDPTNPRVEVTVAEVLG